MAAFIDGRRGGQARRPTSMYGASWRTRTRASARSSRPPGPARGPAADHHPPGRRGPVARTPTAQRRKTCDWAAGATEKELEQKYGILNAWYVPGGEDLGLDPTMTAINTFPTLFSRYFGLDYELLPDRIYSSQRLVPPVRPDRHHRPAAQPALTAASRRRSLRRSSAAAEQEQRRAGSPRSRSR